MPMDKENAPTNLDVNSKNDEIQETEINEAELDEVSGGTAALDELRRLQEMAKMISDAQNNISKTLNQINRSH